MAKQHINTGVTPDDGTGDTLRQAGSKINSNFDELYAALASSQSINSIVQGEGIIVTNNGGVVTISNALVNPTINASNLTGSSLAANVTGSSLTSVGTLVGLTVTNPIVGSITGSAPAGSLSGVVLAPNILNSSLTSLGTLNSLQIGTSKDTVQSSILCAQGATTTIYTASTSAAYSMRLFIVVKGREDGGGTLSELQVCEMILAKGYNSNDVAFNVYGITYTGLSVLATFDAIYNLSLDKIQIRCTVISAIYPLLATVKVTEVNSN